MYISAKESLFVSFCTKKRRHNEKEERKKSTKRPHTARERVFTQQTGYATRVSTFRHTKRLRTARERSIAPPPGGAGGGRGALLAVRRRRNNLGVSLLITFLFAPAVSKRKVAMDVERQNVRCFRAQCSPLQVEFCAPPRRNQNLLLPLFLLPM